MNKRFLKSVGRAMVALVCVFGLVFATVGCDQAKKDNGQAKQCPAGCTKDCCKGKPCPMAADKDKSCPKAADKDKPCPKAAEKDKPAPPAEKDKPVKAEKDKTPPPAPEKK